MNIYALKDKVADRFITTTLAESDDLFVRQSLYAILMDYPLKDIEFYCVGKFDCELGIIKPCVPRLCSWECYKFPTTRMDKEKFLSLSEIEEAAQNKKSEFLKQTKDKKIDVERYLSSLKAHLDLEENKDKKDKKRIKELREEINNVSLELSKLKEVC